MFPRYHSGPSSHLTHRVRHPQDPLDKCAKPCARPRETEWEEQPLPSGAQSSRTVARNKQQQYQGALCLGDIDVPREPSTVFFIWITRIFIEPQRVVGMME